MSQDDQEITVSVVFRRTESSEPLKKYAEEKILNKVKKYVFDPVSIHITLDVEKHDHTAEVHVTAKGLDTKASVTNIDMYAAIDKVSDTIEGQLRKHKGKIISHRHQTVSEPTSVA